MASTQRKTGKQSDEQPAKEQPVKIGSIMEAETVFKSPYYSPSYQFPTNPDPLCSGNSYSKYDEMRDDDQVKAVLSVKKDFVISTGWHINCDKDEVKEFIQDNFENIGASMDSYFEDILRNILTSYDYGFSLSEPIFEIVEGKYRLKSIVVRPPHTFEFNIDDKGNVLKVVQYTSTGPKPFSPDIFLHYANGKEFSNPYGSSDLRPAYQPYKAKKFIERMYARYIERFASPTVVGKYPPSFEPGEIQEFYEHLNKIQNSTSIVIPDGTTVDFIEANNNGGDTFITAINHYNMMIARSVLIPDLMGISGGEIKGGAYALGKEQFKMFLETIKKDRKNLERKITQRIVVPLVKLNFGDIPCTFEFNPYERESALLDIWVRAVNGKVFEPNKEEINYLRSSLGFPEGDVVIPEKPEPGQFPGQFPGQKSGQFPPKADEKKPGEDPEEKEDPKEKEMALQYSRAFTAYEKKIDFALTKDTLVSKADKFIAKSKSPAKDIAVSMIEQIRDEVLLKRFNPDKINQIQPKYLKDLNMVFKRHFTDIFKSSTNQAQKELFPDKAAVFAEDLLPEEFLELLQSEAFKAVGDYATEISKKAKNIAVQGLKNGIPHAEIVRLMRDELEVVSERWLEKVIRTKTTEIYNEARKRYWETDEYAKQIVVAYQWSAILDDRVSDICESLDGKIISIEESASLKPPAHFNCRSILVPITKFEDYELSEIPSAEDLKGMGGNLLMFTTEKKYSASTFLSRIITVAGDMVLVEKPGEGSSIYVESLDLCNLNYDKAVQVMLKDSDNNIIYPTMLEPRGGKVFREFKGGLKLNPNSALIVHLSCGQEVSVVINYRVN